MFNSSSGSPSVGRAVIGVDARRGLRFPMSVEESVSCGIEDGYDVLGRDDGTGVGGGSVFNDHERA